MEPNGQKLPPHKPFVPTDEPIDVNGVERGIKNALLSKIQRLIGNYPDRTLEVIRKWMAERSK